MQALWNRRSSPTRRREAASQNGHVRHRASLRRLSETTFRYVSVSAGLAELARILTIEFFRRSFSNEWLASIREGISRED